MAEVLRQAAGEGRLDLEELDERLEATYAARTYADLVPITQDLPAERPAHPPVQRPAAGPATRYESSVAVMSGVDRKGVWEVGPTHTALSVMGGVGIDLREAVFTGPEVVITANTLLADTDDEARRLALPGQLMRLAIRTNRLRPVPTLEEAVVDPAVPAHQVRLRPVDLPDHQHAQPRDGDIAQQHRRREELGKLIKKKEDVWDGVVNYY